MRTICRVGRRGGKTSSLADLAVEEFLDGERVLYATPTAEQIGRFWKEVKRALADPINRGIFTKNETLHTIEFPGTEQAIRAKTAWNADGLRGDYATRLILDEFQLMNEDTWSVVGAPMMLDKGDVNRKNYKLGSRAWFSFTPPSINSRSVSKAKDPRHASKMFKSALAEMEASKQECEHGLPLIGPRSDDCNQPRKSFWNAIHASSRSNPHLSEQALRDLTKDMTALAIRQEIEAEDVEEMPGALWRMSSEYGKDGKITRYGIEESRVHPNRVPESFARVGVGVDPSGGVNEIGIIGAGVAICNCKGYPELHGFILEDFSLKGSPKQWGDAVSTCYHKIKADRVYGEKNFGGEMVESTIKQSDKTIHYEDVNASRGKSVRAEPVSALYEKGMIHHVGRFDKLENEMVTWVPGISKWSPNRVDGLTWIIVKLLVGTSSGSLAEVSSYAPSHHKPIFSGFRTKVL